MELPLWGEPEFTNIVQTVAVPCQSKIISRLEPLTSPRRIPLHPLRDGCASALSELAPTSTTQASLHAVHSRVSHAQDLDVSLRVLPRRPYALWL